MIFKNINFSKEFKEFRHLIDNLYDEVMIYDDCYNIVYVNNACERHYNCSAESMIGKSFFDFVSQKNSTWDCSILPIVYEEKKPYMAHQSTIFGASITTIAIPIFDDKNNIKYVVMSVRDNPQNITLYNPNYVSVNLDNSTEYLLETNSKKMKEIIKIAEKISTVDVSCILTGESGTGKSILAKYIHSSGTRKGKPFISLNCASIPENLVESELFGYEKGAFTGANNSGKKGLIETADGGTLLLDEISELPLTTQAKLLQFLQEKKIMPIGSNKEIKVDVRIIAATNRDLKEMVKNKLFREDLYYRLNVIELHLPALRERKEDIPYLVKHFFNIFNKKYSLNKKISDETIEYLKNEKWHGNIRELQHRIERLIITSENDLINISNFIKYQNTPIENNIFDDDESFSFEEKVDEFKAQLINKAYKKYNSSRKLANYLKITQTKANNLINKYVK
ncbi:sigma-54-dependent Fis family transcriptional regulator [Fusobacterium sp. FSA-380-WT-3A]|uniref:sigma-54 interaction domain-containing protein n=1 Tax=Fusobacterium sp. FSA-380-WT-3A TaxID=2725304 RepID=UPI001476D8DF|nr:sigma 54-interacting transcriptional regulator [Fusobacterium sp. FSA-380-WT-3A]NME35834.1 sigma 54-interacting transcriptional regulator [Fusobacterium sp. FSA-380-WT-3A]